MKTFTQSFCLLLVTCSLFWLSTAQAQNQNILVVHDATGYADSTIVILVEAQTEDNFVAIQFDLVLPAGFTYIPNSAHLIFPPPLPPQPGYLLNAGVLPGTNTLRAITFSLTSLPFPNGLMISLAAETPSQTGVYPLNIENGIIGNATGLNILTGSINGTATIIPSFTIIPGDANCDGNVNVADVLTTINYVIGNNPQPFCFENADVNGDGVVNVIDVTGTINIILSGGFVCGVSTLTDIDDNIYNTVQIGSQCWMKENLKTTKYRNNTPIEYPGSNNSAWQVNTSGAYAWYNNDISWKDSYGALYNWFAVNNSNGLCPEGWLVPGNAAWTQLTDYIGGIDPPNGNRLKSCRQIGSPIGGECSTEYHPRWEGHALFYGTDDFGFSGLPGGHRGLHGNYLYIGAQTFWWTSTQYTSSTAWNRALLYDYPAVSWGNGSLKNSGFAVRCIKDGVQKVNFREQ